uniref:Uncharacterized protein n=1 Tax=Candidatus Kentrum sp. FW TaxID=2126338 RepID=A0A450SP26_9GAMM|nr:MAG: hypothetical protein BECKFW1821B_GA0114236_101414 [Candidatus Kentron sp. FW]VFJ55680.1 MAG: hypothetical protein BECKFW1821A_GA0114235_10559 [Candidatus Kentron sp. FW]
MQVFRGNPGKQPFEIVLARAYRLDNNAPVSFPPGVSLAQPFVDYIAGMKVLRRDIPRCPKTAVAGNLERLGPTFDHCAQA